MEVILMQKVANLGNIGDKVKVKSGYGRNFLLPKGKATLAETTVPIPSTSSSSCACALRKRSSEPK